MVIPQKDKQQPQNGLGVEYETESEHGETDEETVDDEQSVHESESDEETEDEFMDDDDDDTEDEVMDVDDGGNVENSDNKIDKVDEGNLQQ